MPSRVGPLTTAACALLLLASTLSADESGAVKIIVHPSQTAAAIRQEQLVGIYLGKVPRWGDRTPITPVDQSTRSAVRAAFAKGALSMPIGTFQSYWVRRVLASGQMPPVVKESDQDVIAFVGSTPGAIGYVSANAAIGEGVRVLTLIN